MSLAIFTNVASANAQRNLGISTRELQSSLAHLSSGLRINDASDDAAGLALSEKMGAQISGFAQAERNANDGISLVQTANGAMTQQANILTRMRALAVESSNDTLSDTTRASTVQAEFTQLQNELDRIATSTKFNGINLLNNTNGLDMQVGADNATNNVVTVTMTDTQAATLKVDTGTINVSTKAAALTSITNIDAAIDTLSTGQAGLGAAQNRLQFAIDNVTSMNTNVTAAQSRIRDVDVAAESANMSRNSVLVQAGTAILAQANQLPSAALSLLK